MPDLHGVGKRVEHAHRDEAGPARRRLERPTAVDQIRRGGAGDEADGLGHVDVQPGPQQQDIQPEVDDRRQPAGDYEPPYLRRERRGSAASEARPPGQPTQKGGGRCGRRCVGVSASSPPRSPVVPMVGGSVFQRVAMGSHSCGKRCWLPAWATAATVPLAVPLWLERS